MRKLSFKKISAVLICSTLLTSLPVSANPDVKLQLEDEQNTVNIFSTNVQSVVHVSSIKTVQRSFFDLNPIEVPSGTGTGFVWDNSGHIVTNFHVVQGSKNAVVSFHNDKVQYKAEVVGMEPAKDLAVLRLIEKPKALRPVQLADSDQLIVGQKAMAIGNPFGLDHTITSGIISALGRKIEGIGGVTINGVIQTDASINPGNSGGPLLNSRGEVIGINTMIISPSGSSAGIGFAVPINEAKRAVPQLIQHGRMIRPVLGIQPMPDHYQERFGIDQGLAILEVVKDSPAAKIKLQGVKADRHGRYFLGDIIVEMDGKPIKNYDDYFQVMDKKQFGELLKLKILRDGKEKSLEVQLFKMAD